MTTPVFPQLPGQGWPLTRSPIWRTGIQTTQSGREMRAAYMSYPLYKWSATFEVLRNSASFPEFQQLLAFFNECQGSFAVFNFTDPDDNFVTAQGFGVGDGVTTSFQLAKSFGGYVEPVLAPEVVSQITVAGTVVPFPSGWSLNVNTGIVTFTTAPANGAALAWTGNFYYPCRFLADTYDFDRTMSTFYGAKKLEFQSVKL
jgi:uncharacterized protein (TIGR02217 family)